MATPIWQPGTLYPTGAIVRPVSKPPSLPGTLQNPSFESGDTGWTKMAGWAIVNIPGFDGLWLAEFSGSGVSSIANDARAPVSPGQAVTASAMVAPRHVNNGARVVINWYNASNASIGFTGGNLITGDVGWVRSSASGQAPAGAAFASVDVSAARYAGPTVYADQATWNLTSTSTSSLIFKAVQPETGASGPTEPAWPNTVGVQVIDNEVIWEAMQGSRVVWEAHPILVSGPVEPLWPTVVGSVVADNTIAWETVSRRVEDTNCPNTKVVTIASSKVYAVDEDIVRYCATVNPLDWSSEDDAGYLPTGLNQNGSNDTAVLNLYRKNVVSFSPSTFQYWQVDPDPSQMSLLDSMEGIGSRWQLAAQPVANDMFYLASLGVRSVGVTAGSTNLSAGDVGMPIDSLVQAKLEGVLVEPLAHYYPSMGQYMLFFGGEIDPGNGPTITGDAPDGTVGVDYSYTYSVTGGTPPYFFEITEGALPFGLNINPETGEVFGAPIEVWSDPFTITVYDIYGLSDPLIDTILVSDP